MAKIKLLPKEIYSKIAAGEIIDGPYSIVRELLDNSIDAEASSIKIITKNAGKELIIVHDDGVGMAREDAELALKRHATSKISSIDDLEHIRTMGFRGEALSAICSVSDLEITTKEKDNDVGTRVICEYGKISKVEPVPFTEGTKVIVRNLFDNIPARKKFLKSNRSEGSRIKDVIIKKALCFSEIAIRYEAEDKLLFSLPPFETKRERIKSIFGQDIDKHFIELKYQDDNFFIEGYITNREYTLSNRNGQYLFINHRPVYNKGIQFVINEAAKRFIAQGKYIYAFIYIDVNPELIDVNVHPAKLEVKLKIEKEIISALYHVIQNAYQKSIYSFKGQIDTDYRGETPDQGKPFEQKESYDINQQSLSLSVSERKLYHLKDERIPSSYETDIGYIKDDVLSEVKELNLRSDKISTEVTSSDLNIGAQFKYIGAIFNGFLIFDNGELVLLIDQHAAHERILYESFAEKYDKLQPAKNLLIPINLTPPPGMYDSIMDYADEFISAGIEIEPFGDNSFNIISVPAFLPEDKETKIIMDFFNEFFERNSFPESGSIKDRFLKYAACKSAIKEGDKIIPDEAFYIIDQLFNCKVPYVCPHGRPTILKIERSYIERLFKRR